MKDREFKSHKVEEFTEKIISNFKVCFRNFGYIEHSDIPINSKADTSVYFIGSTISVLKPYLITEEIPDKGYFLVQRCIRTQNLKIMLNGGKLNWSSYFRSIGTLSPYSRLNEVGMEIWEYLTEYLKIPSSDIRIRVSSKDEDLLGIWKSHRFKPCLEIDSKEQLYYKHKYGMEHIRGRNLNFALRKDDTDSFEDIGNLIVIEKGNDKLAVELAFGVSTMIARMNSLDNAIQSSTICKFSDYTEEKSYLLDSLAVAVHLIHEGLRPTASNTRGRLLRSYIRNMQSYCNRFQYSVERLCEEAKQYELDEYGKNTDVEEKLMQYMRSK
ncbi:hypothetical protein [[Clostridium] polysaccharolyticum]|uniref:tRNA synthetases class II (A) n=1 Tax=[Clostridium] polysaccharolyticum TaxID=29364 RepID=A0A1I0G3Z3_9FIRM|nr:hypothetical protein [[Clostridium] polysaccharolyticum]SET64585.1 tRNA synthetases class II (A) [[Clostridium] polysaccharolyticum]